MAFAEQKIQNTTEMQKILPCLNMYVTWLFPQKKSSLAQNRPPLALI